MSKALDGCAGPVVSASARRPSWGAFLEGVSGRGTTEVFFRKNSGEIDGD